MRAAPGLTLLALALLGGCGQKGPLYLPDKGGAVVTAPPAAPGAAPAQSAPTPQDTPATAPPKKTDKDDDSKSPH